MNNRLISLAAAVSLLVPLAAHGAGAVVTFYGVGHLSLNYENNDNPTPGQVKDTVSLTSNQSHLGISAVEPLPNKWRAVARVEGGVEFDSGSIFSERLRDTYVGLGGPFGLIRAGHYGSAYKTSTEWMDPFKDTPADAQAVLGNVNGAVLFSQWYSNIVGWQSPVYKHTQLDVEYIVNQGNDNLPQTTSEHKRSGFSLSTQYRNRGLAAGFAYERRNATTNSGGVGSQDIGAFKVFGGMWLPRAKRHTFVTAAFENAQQVNATATGTNDRNAFYASVSQRIGRNMIKGAFGVMGSLSGANNSQSGGQWIAFGVTHAVSRTIEIYALFTMALNDKLGTYGLGQYQGEAAPGSGNIPALPDRNVAVFSLGFKMAFEARHSAP